MIIIPLLSSADLEFANQIKLLVNRFQDILSTQLFLKIIFFVVLFILVSSVFLSWTKNQKKEIKYNENKLDSVISGIVIAGILLIYLFFLFLQIKKLWIGELPAYFSETESLVKSGFWQLVVLTFINGSIFFVCYKKTYMVVQNILFLFTVSSLFLIFSATQRVWLYVKYYGFSYEKFFAFYVVLFSIIIFVWLIIMLFRKKRSDILKFIFVLFLWMYSITTIFPMEWTMVKFNLYLAQKTDSKIIKYEMTMFSPDVYKLLKALHDNGDLSENKIVRQRKNFSNKDVQIRWKNWFDSTKEKINNKKWYEKNIINMIVRDLDK